MVAFSTVLGGAAAAALATGALVLVPPAGATHLRIGRAKSGTRHRARSRTTRSRRPGGTSRPHLHGDIVRCICHPYGLAFDASGNLWSANTGLGTITEYTSAQLAAGGSPTAHPVTITTTGSPDGLAFNGAGDLWGILHWPTGTLTEYTPTQLKASGNPVPVVTIKYVINTL